MVSTFRRIVILLITTLIAGFLINQLYSEGIRWPLLKLPPGDLRNDSKILYMSVDSALTLHLQGKAIFIDVRPEEEFQLDHIPGAISISLFSFYKSPEMLDSLDKNDHYILYCFDAECEDTNRLANELVNRKFNRVSILFGGFSAWLEQGYPVEGKQ